MYPMVEYAHKIGKNTAEFTVSDMVNYMKWWMKQPDKGGGKKVTPDEREEFMKDPNKRMTPQQRKEYEKDVAAMKKYREETTEETTEEVVSEEEVVCSMELTRVDVDALLWALNEVFENYDLTGTTYDNALASLKEGLMGVE
jgi:hypothetical protein